MIHNMWFVWLGIVSAGLMWGWLITYRVGSGRHAYRNIIVLIGATLLLATAISWRVERRAFIPFLIITFMAFCVHFEWRRLLKRRFDS